MAEVRLEDIHKTYPNGQIAARGLELSIADGELFVLVGPSGCGKSTALRLVAGLESPSRGRIRIAGEDVTDWPPQKRDLAMVFQSYALYPHMSVAENLAFGLRMRGMARAAIAERVAESARLLGIDALLDRKPRELSGGQRQRVALGRALVRRPRAFLFDEPLSNLDARLRIHTRAELLRLSRKLGATMLYVTHDQEEAMTLGQRVAVMDSGRLRQCAAPMEIYRKPADLFVARFVGSPAINLLEARLRKDGAGQAAELDGQRVDIEPVAAEDGLPITLGIRPHDVVLCEPEASRLKGQVDVVELLGSSLIVHLRCRGELEMRVVVEPDARIRAGDQLGLRLPPERLHLFDTRRELRLEPAGA